MKAKKATAAAPAAKLTPEQSSILLLIQQSGYTAPQLQLLFQYIGKPCLPEFCSDLDAHLDDYISQVDALAGHELAAFAKLYGFLRLLSGFNQA